MVNRKVGNNYKHCRHNLPIPISKDARVSFNTGDFEYIAIDNQKMLYKVMSEADLLSCHKKGTIFICDYASVLKKAPDHDDEDQFTSENAAICMYSLFSRRFQLAFKTCPRKVIPAENSVVNSPLRSASSPLC